MLAWWAIYYIKSWQPSSLYYVRYWQTSNIRVPLISNRGPVFHGQAYKTWSRKNKPTSAVEVYYRETKRYGSRSHEPLSFLWHRLQYRQNFPIFILQHEIKLKWWASTLSFSHLGLLVLCGKAIMFIVVSICILEVWRRHVFTSAGISFASIVWNNVLELWWKKHIYIYVLVIKWEN